MDAIPVSLAQYVDKGFVYALCIYLLWMHKDLLTGFKSSIDKLSSLVDKLTTVIDERIKKD